MENKIKILKDSPMFHMSLHSKELFHSNFLAWLGEDMELREVFLNVMEAIGITPEYLKSWGNNFVILREKFKFDLLIKAPDTTKIDKKGQVSSNNDGEFFLVIENKIKSIPKSDQLEKYSIKLENSKVNLNQNFKKLLLSIEKYDGAHTADWETVTYSQIIEGLEKPVKSNISQYKKDIISDYTRMLKALIAILSNIKVDKDETFLTGNTENQLRKDLEALRIEDLYDKWRTAKIANLISQQVGMPCDVGYTNKTPLIECKVDFSKEKNGDNGTIQIQGSQYRRCITTSIPKDKLGKKYNNFLYENCTEFKDALTKEYPDVFSGSSQKKDFCCYGEKNDKPFWYQYVTIAPSTKISQIADCIKEDLENLSKFKEAE